MKLVEKRGPGWITITRVYDPGEKYTCAIGWRRGQGHATKQSVESLYPDCKFLGVKHYTGWDPNTFNRKSFTTVIVERVQA